MNETLKRIQQKVNKSNLDLITTFLSSTGLTVEDLKNYIDNPPRSDIEVLTGIRTVARNRSRQIEVAKAAAKKRHEDAAAKRQQLSKPKRGADKDAQIVPLEYDADGDSEFKTDGWESEEVEGQEQVEGQEELEEDGE